jgi:hypothetical protein
VKSRIVPSSEITPEKGLRAEDYVDMKTLSLNLPDEIHEHIEALILRRTEPISKAGLAKEALLIGLNVLEGSLDELDKLAEEPT